VDRAFALYELHPHAAIQDGILERRRLAEQPAAASQPAPVRVGQAVASRISHAWAILSGDIA
jgi:hypothetical protein